MPAAMQDENEARDQAAFQVAGDTGALQGNSLFHLCRFAYASSLPSAAGGVARPTTLTSAESVIR